MLQLYDTLVKGTEMSTFRFSFTTNEQLKNIGCHKYHSDILYFFMIWGYNNFTFNNIIFLYSYTTTTTKKCCLKKYVYNFTIYDDTIAVILYFSFELSLPRTLANVFVNQNFQENSWNKFRIKDIHTQYQEFKEESSTRNTWKISMKISVYFVVWFGNKRT